MRFLLVPLVVLGLSLPLTAQAGTIMEASIGYGMEVAPDAGGIQDPSVMLAVGWTLIDIFRAQVGFAAAYPKTGGLDPQGQFQIRPMLVFDPPALPFFLRATFAVKDPFSDDRRIDYGGSIGWNFTLLDIGLFAEVGVLPIGGDTVHWLVEGRGGAIFTF